jgi:hypothetical protein
MPRPNSDQPVATSDILGLRTELRQAKLDLQDRITDLHLRVAYLRLYGIVAASILFLGLLIIGRKD